MTSISKRRFAIRVFAGLASICCALRLGAAADDGVRAVMASADTIDIGGIASNVIFRIAELRPWQQAVASNLNSFVGSVTSSVSFGLRIPRFDGERDRLFSSFISLKQTPAGRLSAVGTNRFVQLFLGDSQRNPFPELSRYKVSFPEAASKKGLQVQMVDDAIALGVKHAAFNVNFSQMVDLRGTTNSLPWPIDGQTVYFRRAYIEQLDRQVKPLSDAGAVITLILLAYESPDPALNKILLHPGYSKSAPNHLGAFNTTSEEGVRHFRACIEILADRFARPGATQARVANFILGNEVNSHWFWANMGLVSMEEFAEDYLRAARIASTALRRVTTGARLYLSLEHHWNIRYPGGDAQQAFAGRPFLDYFGQRAFEQGDFEWHLAFHPYPENLFESRTWNDKSATTNVLTTPRITFKNIELLPQYMGFPAFMTFTPHRVILSEQGFHTPDGPEGEIRQAAAYAYAWKKIEHLEGIDAFILHRHVDHPHEGGLKLGLWRRDERDPHSTTPIAKKKIYEVFRLADTPEWEKAFEFALPIIGIKSWAEMN